ncbi:MAG: DUF4180 domain-containing protein [Candidatus Acidiferrales bacterium]
MAKKLRTRRDATDVMSEVFSPGSEGVRMLAIPIARLDEDFFRLKTGVAGEIVPRFVGYGTRAAFVGDISQYVEASESFRDFVREANRGKDFWFVADFEELRQRLAKLNAKAEDVGS